MKILKHVFLIIVIAVILFPITWVVMTSLRRDEAAFSPHLFSKNLTLQHYKDLLLPPDNIPHFIRELMNGIGLLPPYDSEDLQKVMIRIEKILNRFEDRLERSEELVDDSLEIFKTISRSIEERFPNFRNDLVSRIERFASEIEKIEGEVKMEAVGKLIADGKKGNWYEKLGIEREEALKSYEDRIGKYEKRLKELEVEISSLKERISSLTSELQDLSLEYAEVLRTVSLMERDISSSIEKIETALKISGDEEIDLSNLLKKVDEVLKLLSFHEDLVTIYEVLSRFSKIPMKMKVSDEAKKVVEDNCMVLRSLLEGIEYQLGKLSDLSLKIDQIEKEKTKLEEKLDVERLERSALEKKYEKILEDMKGDIEKAYKVYLAHFLRSRSEKISKMDSLSKRNLLKLSIYHKSMRSELRYAERLLEKSKTKILESIVDSLSWIADYRSLSKAMSNLDDRFEKLESEMRTRLERVLKKWKELFEISKRGYKVYPEELDEMYEILGSMYEGKVSSALGIAMRESRSLSYIVPFGDLRGDFRRIDANLYKVQQWWEKKIKHYFLRWVMNSVIVSGLVAIITTFVCALAAYPFSRMRFFGRRYGIMALLLIQMFPAIMYMVALYGMLKFLGNYIPWLGLDTLGGLIFVYLGGIAFNMYLMKGYYDTIPSSLEESAMIDGATRFQTFWLIIVPLARPIIAVVIILTFIGTFNEFVLARIILQDVKNYTYALGLWSFSTGPFETEWGLFTAAALLGMLPMVILFLSMQRFLISGLTKGSVKG